MSWTEEKVAKLKELWGKGNTASQIAEIIGGISRNAVIGKAHRLNLSAKIKTRTATSNESFENSVNDNEWVLVDFWAPWCGPCKAIAPVLEQVASEREILIAKVDTDSNPANAGKLGVRGIPALFLYHNGKVVSKQSGAMPKPALLSWIDQHMTADDF